MAKTWRTLKYYFWVRTTPVYTWIFSLWCYYQAFYFILSVTSHIICIATRCLINFVYQTAFIRSWWRCTFWITSFMRLNQHKNRKWRHNDWLKSETMSKLINRIPGSCLLISSLARLVFENASWNARQASRCQQAFTKPCLVNLISKDTHLVFYIYIWISGVNFVSFPVWIGSVSSSFSDILKDWISISNCSPEYMQAER